MVIQNCFTPPPQGDAAKTSRDAALREAIQAAVANVGQIIEKLTAPRDETPPEPSGMVTFTKTVTTYEFDAEGVGKALVKVAGAVLRGFKWEPSGLPEANVGVPIYPEDGGIPVGVPSEAAKSFAAMLSDLGGLEGPDGKLKPEFVTAVVATLVGSRPVKEAALGLAADMILSLAPERHREQLMNEITRLSVEDSIRRADEAGAAAREARGPIITPPPADASKHQPPPAAKL